MDHRRDRYWALGGGGVHEYRLSNGSWRCSRHRLCDELRPGANSAHGFTRQVRDWHAPWRALSTVLRILRELSCIRIGMGDNRIMNNDQSNQITMLPAGDIPPDRCSVLGAAAFLERNCDNDVSLSIVRYWLCHAVRYS